MGNVNKIIVCAHCVYPQIISSEGIVNRNWFDILNQRYSNLELFSSEKSVKIIKNKYFISVDDNRLKALYYWSKLPKRSPLGLLYRILNKLYLKIFNFSKERSLYQTIWVKIQTKNILKISDASLENIVYWSRILPTFSVLPILYVWKEKRIPFVVNINDPFQNNLDGGLNYDEYILIETVEKAQCWTFPSQRLAASMANKYNLDITRCFVIPHAMRKQEKIYDCKKNIKRKLKFVYTGTFYKSAFTNTFGNELRKFSMTEEMKKVEFIFILSQYDDFALQWINENIPNVTIHLKLDRDRVLEITSNADCMLVIDSITHQELLKGKLVEAISQGLPILAITYENSVMDSVVKEYGGISSYQNIESDISVKLNNMVRNLEDYIWRFDFCKKRRVVMEKISEENIIKATIEITQFALERFLWKEGRIIKEPKAPTNYNWP